MFSLIVILISYLVGSIPFGFLIAKSRKIDIRGIGSGNIGATNISRALGFKYAVVVGICDVTKGLLPTLYASLAYHDQLLISGVAFSSVMGNLFPLYLKFKGGKGVTTFAGSVLVIFGIKLFLVIFTVWLVCVYLTRIMSFTNLLISLFIPLIAIFILHSTPYFIYTLIAVIFIWWAHRANIVRLLHGTEKKLTMHGK